ncbi:MAG: hypothetical protein NUV97_01010 [archaeon]|nr:hypothetical protein [archaeon]MCR4323460.1 hypothetical protein [Nanoarchaeota archaeon]
MLNYLERFREKLGDDCYSEAYRILRDHPEVIPRLSVPEITGILVTFDKGFMRGASAYLVERARESKTPREMEEIRKNRSIARLLMEIVGESGGDFCDST